MQILIQVYQAKGTRQESLFPAYSLKEYLENQFRYRRDRSTVLLPFQATITGGRNEYSMTLVQHERENKNNAVVGI